MIMNYNYQNFQVQNYRPMVYDPQFGYVEPHKLPLKKLRSSVNSLSLMAICMLGASMLLSLVTGVLFGTGAIHLDAALYPESGGIPTQIYYAMQMFFVPLSTGLPFVIYLAAKKESFSDLVRTKKFGFGVSLMIVLAGGGICLALNFPSLFLGDLIESAGLEPGYSETPPVKDLFSGIVYFVGVAVMPAIFEEFAFRGVILGSLRKYGKWFALIVSSVIFGLMHMNATSILFATLAGLVMGYVYLLTDNIWVGAGIHFMNNAIAVILDIASVNLNEIVYGLVNLILFYVPMFLAVVFIVILLIMNKLKLPKHPQTEVCTLGNKFSAICSSWGFISLLVIMAGFVVMGLYGVL